MRPHPAHFGLRWKCPPMKNAHGARTASRRKGNPKASSASAASLSSKLRLLRGAGEMLAGSVIVEVLPEPPLDLCHAHRLTLVIVGDLVAVDFAEAEIS